MHRGKWIFPLMVCGFVCLGTPAEAQIGIADITSISTTPGLEGTTVYSAGSKIEIKIGVLGNVGMTNSNPGPYTLPQLRVVVNGESSAFAQMEADPSYYPATSRTYFTFWYMVKPGDMAAPMKIYGLSGGASPGDKYDVVKNGYVFYNKTTSGNLVWRYAASGFIASDVLDPDFAQVAKRSIKTLSFDDLHSPVTVAATENAMWRVTTQNPVENSAVTFYVWPANTNLVRVGSVPGQCALLVSMPVGTATVDFPITGLSTGTTEIILQRVSDYNSNATLGVRNQIARPITVTVPPATQAVATPMSSPASGTVGTNELTVTLVCATVDAKIRYTLDDFEPTGSSPLYTNALTLTRSARVLAKAFKSGMAASETIAATYTVIPTVSTPVFTPVSGTQGTNSLEVTITSATEGAVLRYTLDGSAPTTASTVYTGAITLMRSATVRAKAFKYGMADSIAVAATYTVINPDFDIIDVRVLCNDQDGTYSTTRFQPLVSDNVGVEARLSNIQFTPSNIQMYVTYYIGTNIWGVDKWPAGQTSTKPMYPVVDNPLVFRTLPTNDIPVQAQDQVVQYCVWAAYQDGIPLLKRQETYETPSWYYPVDLNLAFAAQGWAPYYVVYGTPSGAVWINEVNATDYVISNGVRMFGIWDNPYIEIAVPAGVDLGGWKVDLVTTDGYATRTIQIPAGLPAQEAYTNGYAFFVIGEHPAFRPPEVPPLPKLDYGFPGLADWIPQVNPGGLRLRRPLGMYEQAVAYDWDPAPDYGASFSGANWAANDPEQRFVYVGREYNSGSLSRIGTTDSTNTWMFPRTWTPGWPNQGQTVPHADAIPMAAEPVFTPPSLTSATNTLVVTIRCEALGATVRYTLDGSVPTAESAVYVGAITLTQSAIVKAKAFKDGMLNSATAAATYTVVVPDFDLVDVKILFKDSEGTYSTTRTQPLDSDAVGVEARIANAQMSPSNIEMFVSYYVGTNVWGVDNWPVGQIVTKAMFPTVENPMLYRTSPINDISEQEPDQVVQYRVWAKYWVGVPRVKHQETSEKPPVFYQVDLNEVFAAQGWSPYYIVYGPSGSAAWPLDVVSIKSDQANTICTASGSFIDFNITLAGNFQLVNACGGTFALLPQIRLVVNGDVAFASLYAVNSYQVANGTRNRTDVIFRYTVKPGDMAQPLQIYGPPALPYQFDWNGWEIRNAVTDTAAVWKFNTGLSLPSEGEMCDLDLTGANITVRTLSYDEAHSPNSLMAKAEATWRVKTVNPVVGDGVDFYVWTPGTNLLQVGAMSNQTAVLVNLPAGATQVDFPIKALGIGSTDIYLQRVKDYQNNSISGVTNAIRRPITLIAPPPPLVRVVMTDNGTDSITMYETSSPNTGSFRIELSEAFTNDVWVRMDTSPLGQSNVTFDTSAIVVRIPAGSLVSPVSKFSVPDGLSWLTSGTYHDCAVVTLTPTVTNADAAATYTRIQNGTVYVYNVPPALLQPSGTEMRTAQRGLPFSFDWAVSDVTADLAAGVTVTWNFGDNTAAQVVHGATGQIVHTFTTVGTKIVRVNVRDKDNESATREFLVRVEQPTVRVVPSAWEYSETTTNNTGSLMVYLTTAFTDDVWIRLSSTLGGHVQSNLVFATDVIRIPQGSTNAPVPFFFSVLDGTTQSEQSGVVIVATVTNAPAAAIFTAQQSATVFVNNLRPEIIQPVAWGQPDVRAVIGRPLTLDYTVKDVPADKPSMVVHWEFDDGQQTDLTGAAGQVTHTYSRLGYRLVSLQAKDKDGGISERVMFFVNVIPVPPPPSVRILAPSGALSEETDSPNTGELTVQLSEAFTNAVTVRLTVSPANSAANGSLVLATNQVLFASGETMKTVKTSLCDGTGLSQTNGFTITPTIIGNAAAMAYYPVMTSGSVKIMNVSPLIQFPFASEITAPALYVLRQGEPWGFNWTVSDVASDVSSLSVVWNFGDGVTQRLSSASGFVAHTYSVTGDRIVSVVASDKDGGKGEVLFKIRVLSPTGGFDLWAARKGISGDPDILLGLDHNGDGIANGFEYAFGTNLTEGVPLLNIRMVDGRPQVETPKRDPDSTVDVHVTVEGCTNLFSGDWSLPMGPSAQSGKPDNRDWYAPLVTVPDKAFFRLRAVRE